MKKLRKLLVVLAFLPGWMFITDLYADPPPLPAGCHGEGNNQPPAGAPIDGGLGILMAMGVAYGGKKFYKARKDRKKEDQPAVEN